MQTSCTSELATKVSALVTSKSYLWNSSLEEILSVGTPCHGMYLNMDQIFNFNREHCHYPVKTSTHRNCGVHIQRVETVYECGISQVRMCPAPCFERYHTLQQYLFNDPERNGAKRLKDVHGRPRTGPGRPRQGR